MTILTALLAFFTVLTVAALAGAVRRLLNARIGTVRTLLAGLLAFAIASPILKAIAAVANRPSTSGLAGLWFFPLGLACAVLVAMVALVVAEVLVPTGSIPSPVEWRRRLRTRIVRVRRYW